MPMSGSATRRSRAVPYQCTYEPKLRRRQAGAARDAALAGKPPMRPSAQHYLLQFDEDQEMPVDVSPGVAPRMPNVQTIRRVHSSGGE